MIAHFSNIIGHRNEKAKCKLCIRVVFIPQLAASPNSCELKDEKAKVQLVHPGSTPDFFPPAGIASWQEGVLRGRLKCPWLAGALLGWQESLPDC